jgi:hypothetical protein
MERFLGYSVSSDIQNEVNNYLRQHEPPMEHQLYRVLTSLSNEILSSSSNIHNIKFMTSNDTNKERFTIILPCLNISSNLQDMLDQIVVKFNYKRINTHYYEELKELHINYKI